MWNRDFEFERNRSIGLGCTFGDDHTDTHTHTHTHTHKPTHTHIFSKTPVFGRGSDAESKFIKKIEVEFFDDCNTSFTSYVVRK